MYLTYGASLRDLFAFAHRPDAYHGAVLSEMRKLSVDGLVDLLEFCDLATNKGLYLMSTWPLPTNRSRPERKFNSPYIFRECCRRVLDDDAEQLGRFYMISLLEKSTVPFARMFFEYRAHQFLQEGRVINFFAILAESSPEGGNYIFDDYRDPCVGRFTLPRLEEQFVDEETEHVHELNTYYRPRNANFSIDSWILIRPEPHGTLFLLVFRIVTDTKERDLNKRDLDRLTGLAPVGALVCPVIFARTGMKPRITVPTAYLTEEFLRGRSVDEAFPVSYSRIDLAELFESLDNNSDTSPVVTAVC